MSSEIIKTEGQRAMAVALRKGMEAARELVTCDEFSRPLVMASAIAELNSAIDDKAMASVMALAGQSLGFRTDKDKPEGGTGYPVNTVKMCLIEAMLRGVSVIGNHFNIIANRFYMTKEGWWKKLSDLGATEINLQIGSPGEITERKFEGKHGTSTKISCKIAFQASCKLNGKLYSVTATDGEVDGRCQVSAFARDIDDAIPGLKGKAEARALRKLFAYVCNIPEELDADDPIETPPPIDVPHVPLSALELQTGIVEPPLGERATAARNAITGAEELKGLENIMRGVKTEKSKASIDELEYDYLMKLGDEKRKELSK